jgi:uncharacterized protein YgbK (DUF1537 family)
MRRFATPLVRNGRRLIKKVDSTLLGHVATETNVILGELGDAAALIAPAFPAMGRSIVNGELYVAGAAAGRSVPELVRQQVGAFCHTLTLDLLRGSLESLAAEIQEEWDRGRRWFAADAELEEDLAIVASVIHASPLTLLPVGSGGLTRVLSRQPAAVQVPFKPGAATRKRDGPVVLFVGSVNPQTDRQLARVATVYKVDRVDLNEHPVDAIIASFHANDVITVRVTWSDAAWKSLEAVVRACPASDVCGVIATGGDTANLVCRMAGCTQLVIEGEVIPGVPFGKFGNGILCETPVVTKAGGFGSEDALVAACKYFKNWWSTTGGAAHA